MPDTNTSLPLRGVLLALFGAAFFSTKSIIIKLAYTYPIDAATLMTLRMMFALPFYLVFAAMALRERRHKGEALGLSRQTLFQTAALGLTGYYLASYLDLAGLHYITSQFERLILFTYPAYVMVLGALFFGHRISLHAVVAILLSYLGIAVIFSQDLVLFGTDVTRGTVLVFGAALSFSIYVLFAPGPIRQLGSRLFTCLAMIAASFGILLHFTLTHDLSALILPLPVYGLALLMAVVATVLPSFLISAAIAEIGPGPTSIFSAVGPVVTALLGVSLLGEPFTPAHLAGMALVIAGVLILSQKNTGS